MNELMNIIHANNVVDQVILQDIIASRILFDPDFLEYEGVSVKRSGLSAPPDLRVYIVLNNRGFDHFNEYEVFFNILKENGIFNYIYFKFDSSDQDPSYHRYAIYANANSYTYSHLSHKLAIAHKVGQVANFFKKCMYTNFDLFYKGLHSINK